METNDIEDECKQFQVPLKAKHVHTVFYRSWFFYSTKETEL